MDERPGTCIRPVPGRPVGRIQYAPTRVPTIQRGAAPQQTNKGAAPNTSTGRKVPTPIGRVPEGVSGLFLRVRVPGRPGGVCFCAPTLPAGGPSSTRPNLAGVPDAPQHLNKPTGPQGPNKPTIHRALRLAITIRSYRYIPFNIFFDSTEKRTIFVANFHVRCR